MACRAENVSGLSRKGRQVFRLIMESESLVSLHSNM